MTGENILNYDTVCFDETTNEIVIIDQTKLPLDTIFLRINDIKKLWEAIYLLQVRGAPAIGVAAAYGMYIAALSINESNSNSFLKKLNEHKEYLISSRPTAVNLSWAVNRIQELANTNSEKTVNEIKKLILTEANSIYNEDIAVCKSIGENGLKLIKDGYRILTHCNAGQLATVRYGTALAPIHLGTEKGMKFKVFTDETRPLLQGARLSAYELVSHGIDTTLVCDNMASNIMRNKMIDAIFVGCDRVAANGDTANKIGTSGLAIIAKYYNIPFYVCAPTSTIDVSISTGNDIKIEERSGKEIYKMWYEKPMAPENVNTYNPAFDVTDHSLITAFVTEHGIVYPSYKENLKKLFENKNKC